MRHIDRNWREKHKRSAKNGQNPARHADAADPELARDAGREIASPQEAREIMGLNAAETAHA